MSGISGHMMHPSDDLSLKLQDLYELAERSLNGSLEMKEKIDGFGLHLMKVLDKNSIHSWRIVRSKSDLEKGGIRYIDLDTRFAHNPKARDLYKKSIEAMSKLDEDDFKQFRKFSENNETYNCEALITSGITNTIDYEGAADVYVHNIWQWNEDGIEVKDLDVYLDVYNNDSGVDTDPIIDYHPKNTNTTSLNKLKKLAKRYDTIEDYYRQKFEKDIQDTIPTKLSKELLTAVFNRMFKVGEQTNLKEIKNMLTEVFEKEELVNKFIDLIPMMKGMVVEDLDHIVLSLGQTIIKNCHGYINEGFTEVDGFQSYKDFYNDIDISIKSPDDPDTKETVKKIGEKLRYEMDRHMKLFDKDVNPLEGVVVKYNDKLYKWTGTFSPVNKILGLVERMNEQLS